MWLGRLSHNFFFVFHIVELRYYIKPLLWRTLEI